MRGEIMWIIIGMAGTTFLTRITSPVLLRYTGIPDWLAKWLKHVPTAILTALIVPTLALPKGYLDLTIHNHYLLAGLVAAVTAYKSRSIIVTMILGMGALLGLRWLGF